MPVVQNVVKRPGGGVYAGAIVRIQLVASTTLTAPGYLAGASIVDILQTVTDSTGTWSATLDGNDTISPTGSYYLVSEAGAVSTIQVTGTGTYTLSQVLVPPPAVGSLGVASSRQILTTAPLTGGGDLSTDRTIGITGATASAVGVVQLAGDLGGTATAPTVPGLASKAADSTVVHTTGNETVAGVKTFSSSPVVPTPTTSGQAGNKGYIDQQAAAAAAGLAMVLGG